MRKQVIPITKPFFPPIEEYQGFLSTIWEAQWLTNQGHYAEALEKEVASWLGVDKMHWVSNGTIALQMAIKALGLKGEIITTPFSYVATTSSIVWENCTPVFVDVDPLTFNLDPKKIEQEITPNTEGILATHVFGIPCDVEAIASIAAKHSIPVIYDAAHTFGVKYKGQSVFEFGDISATSFHATKLFHTVEGGGLFTQNPKISESFFYMRNFGHWGPERFYGLGTNGKNSELHAAMGLCNLKHIDSILKQRKHQSLLYDTLLHPLNFQRPFIGNDVEYNYIYYPILLDSETTLLRVVEVLKTNNIQPRRYFHPLLSTLPYVEDQNTPIAQDIANRVLCLPLYHTLLDEEIEFICEIIFKATKPK